jgi:hypothetical protein
MLLHAAALVYRNTARKLRSSSSQSRFTSSATSRS